MLKRFAKFFRPGRAFGVALLLAWPLFAGAADERAGFDAALKAATAQYRIVLETLETSGREETAAEIARFRTTFQSVIDVVDRSRNAFADDLPALFMQVDVGIVGAMIIIDIGNREA